MWSRGKAVNKLVMNVEGGKREYSEEDEAFGLRSEARIFREIVDFERIYERYRNSDTSIVIVGGLYGKGVQKEIHYQEDKGFMIFDIIVQGSFLEQSIFSQSGRSSNQT